MVFSFLSTRRHTLVCMCTYHQQPLQATLSTNQNQPVPLVFFRLQSKYMRESLGRQYSSFLVLHAMASKRYLTWMDGEQHCSGVLECLMALLGCDSQVHYPECHVDRCLGFIMAAFLTFSAFTTASGWGMASRMQGGRTGHRINLANKTPTGITIFIIFCFLHIQYLELGHGKMVPARVALLESKPRIWLWKVFQQCCILCLDWKCN